MIESIFPSKKYPFVELATNETSFFSFLNSKVHRIIQNYNTKEYKTKCGLTGFSWVLNSFYPRRHQEIEFMCKRCFNL